MLDRGSPDQKMKILISRNTLSLQCFLQSTVFLALFVSQCLALSSEQQNLYQKHLIEDLVLHSNSVVKSTRTFHASIPAAETPKREFDVKFKGRNSSTQRRGGLTIKFKPKVRGISVTCFGQNDDEALFNETLLTDQNGSAFFHKFKPESDLCLVAKAQGESHLVWWQQCLSAPARDRKTEITINFENTEVKPHKVRLTGTDPDGTSFYASIPLDGIPVNLHLTESIVTVGQTSSHSDRATLTTDVNGNVLIFTNSHIQGTLTISGQADYENLSSDLDLDPEDRLNSQHNFQLSAICPEHLNRETSFTGLSTWTETLGLGPRPLTREEAVTQGWKKINERCNESDRFPGFRYENSGSDSDHFLILVFDANGILCGVQVALPKSLANQRFNYENNPYYVQGVYDGEPAYLISMYFADRQLTCRRRTSLELICADGLGGNDRDFAYVIAADKQSQIFLDQKEAKSNGWLEQTSSNKREVYLSPPTETSFNYEAPYVAIYKNKKLVGLTLMHSSQFQKRQTFENTIFEPSNQLVNTNSFSTSTAPRDKFEQEGTLMANFYIGEDDKVKVHLKLKLGEEAPFYPRKYFYWTDSGDHGEVEEQEGKIERFSVKKTSKHIYIFGYYEISSTVHYAIVKVDPCRGQHDVHATIHHGVKSKLEVIETQTERGLSGSTASLSVGVASMHAMEARLKLTGHATVHLDTPKGLLVAWSIEGPKEQQHLPHPERSHSIAPFHKKSSLLKTVNFDIHVCLENPDGKAPDASEKEAVVEVNLEYEWASQDDSRDIIPVDYRGHVYLKNIPSPLPGENLNVTLISRIEKQLFFGSRIDFHRPIAIHSQAVKYNEDGPIRIDFCHEREQLAVVVSNGVSTYRMHGVKVMVKTDSSDQVLEDTTDHEGATFFSFKDASEFEVTIKEEGFDEVKITKQVIDDLQTQVVHIELLPQQMVRIEVMLGDDSIPAIGAVIEYVFDDQTHGIGGVDDQGVFELIVPGSSETIVRMTASLPWQSTCGTGKGGGDETEIKNIFGIASHSDESFPLVTRDEHVVITRRLILPKITKIHYEIGLDGTFPDVALLGSNVMSLKDVTIHLEDKILHDQVSFYVETGARTAHLFSVEWYNSLVILTPLNPCLAVNSDTIEASGDELLVRQTIFHNTVKVLLKTVDLDYLPISNVTIEYIMGETEFGLQSIEVSDEGELIYNLPQGMLVSIEPKSQYIPDPSNPKYFVAKQGLEVVLVFDTRNSINVIVELVGEDFVVPEDTLVRYLAVDSDGDVISSEALFSDVEGHVYFKTRRNVQYIEFSVAGSDGFDPVFYQPFDYVYNVTNPYWTPPLTIEIPVKTLKNVIVAVRDCFTGDLLTEEVLVSVPEDAPRWNSWFNQETMTSRNEGSADDQGLVFFNLEPDQLVPVKVSVKGYKDFRDLINIKSNATYLVEANMCKDIAITLKLVDASNDITPISDATVRIGFPDDASSLYITTNENGKATFDASSSIKRMTLQIVDTSSDVKEPIFELHDNVDFLRDAEVDITVLERMYAIHLSTSSCNGESNYEAVPVLISICYNDTADCEFSKTKKYPKDGGFIKLEQQSETKRRQQFIVTSSESGDVTFRIFESAKIIVAKILEPPPKHMNAVNVGILRKKELPERFDVIFHNLPKQIAVSVRDSHDVRLPGADVTFTYFDPSIQKDETQSTTTDLTGKAEVTIDGCVEVMTFEVNPQSSNSLEGHQCFAEGRDRMASLRSARRSNWDVQKDQKFKINLQEAKGLDFRKVRLSVKSGVTRPDEVRVTTDVDLWTPILLDRQQDPFFNSWHLEIPSSARRAFLVQTDRSQFTIGLVDLSLCCSSMGNGRTISVEGFAGSVEMSVEVVDDNGEPVPDARVVWHLGHGLGTAWVPLDPKGRATLWAPPGEPMVLIPMGSICGQDQAMRVEDAKTGHTITLKCHHQQ